MLLDKVDNEDGLKILKKVKSLGVKTSIDLVSSNSGDYKKIIPCLQYTDNLIVNELEASNLTSIPFERKNIDKILLKLLSFGVKERVIIHKIEYSVCMNNNKEFTFIPSLDIPNHIIKGTTGAGDAFCSGCLVKILQGATDKETLEFASQTAVASLTEKDAVSGVISQTKIKNFCKQFKRRDICL